VTAGDPGTERSAGEVSNPGADLAELVALDHKQLFQLLAHFTEGTSAVWNDLLCEVANELVRHQVVVEQVLYPAIAERAPNGAEVVRQRLAEDVEALRLLAGLERGGRDRPGFEEMVGGMEAAVHRHAEVEELAVVPMLLDHLDHVELRQLVDRYRRAKSAAPRHAHPHGPDEPSDPIVPGPLPVLVDQVRAALRDI